MSPILETARDGVARLFGRSGAQCQTAIEAQLDGNVVLVERVKEPEQARHALVPLWQMELARLLGEHPEVEPELRDVITRVRSALPAEQQQWVQTNIARENSRLFAVQGGDLIYHESSTRDPDTSAPRLDARKAVGAIEHDRGLLGRGGRPGWPSPRPA